MYANDPTTMLAGIMGQRGLAANIYEPSQSWMDFGGKVTGTLAGEEYALKQLATVLPYVDSQEQLASVIARYKEDVWRAGVGGGGEFGAGTGPFDVPGLPGATGTAHEWGQTANFDPYTTRIQNAVNALVGQLPATGGRDALSLANQMFLQRTAAATPFGAGAYPGQLFVRFPDGSFGAQTLAEYEANPMPVAENIWAGDPRYNYAAQGIPDPNWNPGAMSSAWQQMMNPGMNMQPRSDTLPPELLAQLSSLLMPTPTASNSTGLMSLMQGGQQGTGAPIDPRVLSGDEEIRRMMFANYGF